MLARVNPKDRFDLGAAAQHIEAITGDPNTVMNWRVIPESDEAKQRLAELLPDERQKKRFNFRGSLSDVAELLMQKNMSGHGIFLLVNETDGNGRRKENMVAARCIVLDLDHAPLPGCFTVEPHLILETSPGKHQCSFTLERTTDLAAVEDVSRRMAAHYGGDPAVCDATHVFRVAGFIHQKGKLHRVRIVSANEFDPPRKLSDFNFLPQLPSREPSTARSGIGILDDEGAALILAELDVSEFGSDKSWLTLGMALHAASGGDPDVGDQFLDWSEGDPQPKYSRDMNRRRWDSFRLDKKSLIGARTLFKICREHGVSEATLHTVFNDAADDFAGEYVSDSPMFEPDRDGKGPAAPSPTASPPVKLNEVSHDNIDLVFKLVNMGGKARIVYMGKSSIDKSVRVPEVWAVEDLRNALRNKFVTVESPSGTRRIPLANWWLSRRDRYTYDGITFDATPAESHQDEINLWRGYGVDENPSGDWSLLRNHVREVIASGDAASDVYILRWLAWAIQNPTKHCEVALVLISEEEGTGKGFLGRAMCRLFGSHGLHISNRSHLIGKFNAHFMQVGFMFCDEVLWPGHMEDEGVLKALITEPTLLVEPKGINAYPAVNALKIIMASNEPWVVPASGNERRYAVFDVSTKYTQDHGYFARISEQLDNRGLGAMLHDLRTINLDGWHPRQDIPQTEALARQKELTAEPEVKLMGDILDSGVLPGRVGKPNRAQATDLYDHFRRRARTLNYWSDIQFVDFFGKIGAKRKRSNGTVWVFPPLAEARAGFRAGRPWWPPFDPMMTEWESEFEETEGADD